MRSHPWPCSFVQQLLQLWADVQQLLQLWAAVQLQRALAVCTAEGVMLHAVFCHGRKTHELRSSLPSCSCSGLCLHRFPWLLGVKSLFSTLQDQPLGNSEHSAAFAHSRDLGVPGAFQKWSCAFCLGSPESQRSLPSSQSSPGPCRDQLQNLSWSCQGNPWHSEPGRERKGREILGPYKGPLVESWEPFLMAGHGVNGEIALQEQEQGRCRWEGLVWSVEVAAGVV